METVTTLTGVKDRKSGTSARGAWTLTIFSAADGREYSTLKGDVASAAEALIGKLVTVEYSERQNTKDGRTFTNYSLEGVSEAPEGATASPVASNGGGSKGDFRSPAQIIRCTAVEAVAVSQAFELAHDIEGFLTAAAVLEKYITEGLEDEPDA